MKRKRRLKSKGAHGLRIDLMNMRWHIEAAQDALDGAEHRASELGVVDELGVAVKALRTIANSADADKRSRGVAAGALKQIRVSP